MSEYELNILSGDTRAAAESAVLLWQHQHHGLQSKSKKSPSKKKLAKRKNIDYHICPNFNQIEKRDCPPCWSTDISITTIKMINVFDIDDNIILKPQHFYYNSIDYKCEW